MSKKRTQPSEPLTQLKVSLEPQNMVALQANDNTIYLVDRNCALVSKRCANHLRQVEKFIAQLLTTRLERVNSSQGNDANASALHNNTLSANVISNAPQKTIVLTSEEYERGLQVKLPFCAFDSAAHDISEMNEEYVKSKEADGNVNVVFKSIAEIFESKEQACRSSRVERGSIIVVPSALSTTSSTTTTAATAAVAVAGSGSSNSNSSNNNNNNNTNNSSNNDAGRGVVSGHLLQRGTITNLTRVSNWYTAIEEQSGQGMLYPLIDLTDIVSSSLELGILYMYEKYRVDSEIDRRATTAGAAVMPSSCFLKEHAEKRLKLLAVSRLLAMESHTL